MAGTRLQAAAERDRVIGGRSDANDKWRFIPSTGTEISFVRFLGGRADLCRSNGTLS
jgi:hypothetical protein